ncbi:hypothetical protein PCS_01861 [Desulfocurvibacter africanus PCS]|uniref:Uncharacterized protein n=1 Tax=Desulfocurvibacter africanus PCS TaxID=1262666 RepID=M5PTB5_DESAF|nr:hypothetical protein [Desulfocurvibacter africanus]EMG37349.1 hypothetical protein PCS_01861 [Desulfocurvibacter africanus PCS]
MNPDRGIACKVGRPVNPSQCWPVIMDAPRHVPGVLPVALGLLLLACACAKGSYTYSPPVQPADLAPRSIVVAHGPDAAWEATVAYLAGKSYDLGIVARDSRVIHASFTPAQPDALIDCGSVRSWVKELWNRREYDFKASTGYVKYEAMDNKKLTRYERTARLTGKATVLLTPLKNSRTRITVSASYQLTRDFVRRQENDDGDWQASLLSQARIEFTSSSGAKDAKGFQCFPTHALESEILAGIRARLDRKLD